MLVKSIPGICEVMASQKFHVTKRILLFTGRGGSVLAQYFWGILAMVVIMWQLPSQNKVNREHSYASCRIPWTDTIP